MYMYIYPDLFPTRANCTVQFLLHPAALLLIINHIENHFPVIKPYTWFEIWQGLLLV